AVGDGNDVGGDIGGDISRLGLHYRQGGHAAAAVFVVEAGGPLQQSGVEIEHVPGVGFPPWRAVEQQAQLTVSHRMVGQVIVNYQHMAALVHKVFAHGGAGIGGNVQHGGRFGGLGAD